MDWLNENRDDEKGSTGVTWRDLARRVGGATSDEEADFMLYELTCFPFGSILQVARQLRKERRSVDGE